MKSWRQIAGWLTENAQQVAGGKTLVEIVGKDRIVVEYHRGILCYGSEEILLRASFGQIRIQGSMLQLGCMSREQLCITGCIDLVELLGRTG